MSSYLLKFNIQTGVPSLEVFLNAEQIQGHLPGQGITTKADLAALMERYKGQAWVTDLLSKHVDPKTLKE